jgi:hypothetical protein
MNPTSSADGHSYFFPGAAERVPVRLGRAYQVDPGEFVPSPNPGNQSTSRDTPQLIAASIPSCGPAAAESFTAWLEEVRRWGASWDAPLLPLLILRLSLSILR